MDHLFGANSGALVPLVVALIALVVVVRIVIAIERAIIKLALAAVAVIVIVSMLGGGAGIMGRLNTLQGVADAAAHGSGTGTVSTTALQQQIYQQASRTLRAQGLDPAFLRVYVTCVAAHPRVVLRYADNRFMLGMLSNHDFDVTLPDSVHC